MLYITSLVLITGHLYILTTLMQFFLYLLFETEHEKCFCSSIQFRLSNGHIDVCEVDALHMPYDCVVIFGGL